MKTVSKRVVLFTDFVKIITIINIHSVLLAKRTTYLELASLIRLHFALYNYTFIGIDKQNIFLHKHQNYCFTHIKIV